MSLTVLGCDGSYPGPGGAGSGYLVQGGGSCIWIDAGPGTLARLQEHVTFEELDAVIVSHEHPDHCSDLEGLAIALGDLELARGPLEVLAPGGVRERGHLSSRDGLAWREIADGDQVRIGSFDLSFSRTDHGPVTLAVRVDLGELSMGYSADSGPGWSLEALGPGLDLALCEATWTMHEEGRGQHMSARQAGRSASAAGVGRLLLTHRRPSADPASLLAEAAGVFAGPLHQVRSGDRYLMLEVPNAKG